MLNTFLKQAEQDLPVFISDVRTAFQKQGDRPFHLHVLLYDGTVRVFPLVVPKTNSLSELMFVTSYIHANIYNILSSLGAARIDVYLEPSDSQLLSLANNLSSVFQVDLPKIQRRGYGKCLNVNERTLAAIVSSADKFCFQVLDICTEPNVPSPVNNENTTQVFSQLPAQTSNRILLGIDIGGTDIKLAVSVNGELAYCKEYDWFPSTFPCAQDFINPVITLIRLMRDAANYVLYKPCASADFSAMSRKATLDDIIHCCESIEQILPATLRPFDAIGISFPDVVIRNRIVGGETYKTKGIRDNDSVDYESEFSKITRLYRELEPFVSDVANVLITNDGPMAAFTVAVEQSFVGVDVSTGVFAHTLGTELGTGWVQGNGTIPEIPLEVYNFIIDLGSFKQKEFDPDDVRSINNFNTKLPGTLQKYTSQYGAFRLAAKYAPISAPYLEQEAFEKGLLRKDGDRLVVPTAPKDMRKAYLEFLMDKASKGDSLCQQIFKEIGQFLSITWEETSYILNPEAKERTLFGRLVKHPACFKLLCDGAASRTPELVQHAADGSLANTKLMRQLEAHPDYTVAQFAQAVGAIYFGCLGFLS